MNTLARLNELRDHIKKSLTLIEREIALLPKEAASRPPCPTHGTVEWSIWQKLDQLKEKKDFTAAEAELIVKDGKRGHGTRSAFSAVLSQWAKNGHIHVIRQGEGPFPARYAIPN